MAVARAAANFFGLPLYRYIGGAFAQEIPGAADEHHQRRQACGEQCGPAGIHGNAHRRSELPGGLAIRGKTFHALREILIKNDYATGVGDEGSFAPNLKSNAEPFELIVQAIEKAGYKPGEDVAIAIDAAASSFYKDGKYILASEKDPERTAEEMIDFYEELIKKYPIVSLEDGLDEADWDGWKKLMKRLGGKVQIVGDDIFVTDPKFLARGIKEKAANSILIKVNQIGTLTETMQTVEMARRAGFTTVFSHRSGETEDAWLADVAVGYSGGQLKTGSASPAGRDLPSTTSSCASRKSFGASSVFRGKECAAVQREKIVISELGGAGLLDPPLFLVYSKPS